MAWLQRIRESFWGIPALLCLLAAVVAQTLVAVDRRLPDDALDNTFAIVQASGTASRDLLGAIAGSMLAVASTTFSITIAVMALTSSSYGPRLIRNFMADRGNQLVLGTYVATYLYTLLVLRSIRSLEDGQDAFVPQLAVNTAVLLAIVSIGVLVWFIHHISDSIQVWTLAGRVHGELRETVSRLYPEEVGAAGADAAAAQDALAAPPSVVVTATRAGYVLNVDTDRVVELACKADVVVELLVRPGVFVVDGGDLAAVRGHVEDADGLSASLRRSLPLTTGRSPAQDVEYATQQLLEMVVRAMSPSTNDPYTAINAIDQLADALAILARRRTPSPVRVDDQGRVRVVAPGVDLPVLVDMVVDVVRHYARDHHLVVARTMDLLRAVGEGADTRTRGRLLQALELLVDDVGRDDHHRADRARMVADAERVRASLTRSPQ